MPPTRQTRVNVLRLLGATIGLCVLGLGLLASVRWSKRSRIPSKEAVPPFLNFSPLDNAVAALQRVTEQYDKALTQATDNGGSALARRTTTDDD